MQEIVGCGKVKFLVKRLSGASVESRRKTMMMMMMMMYLFNKYRNKSINGLFYHFVPRLC